MGSPIQGGADPLNLGQQFADAMEDEDPIHGLTQDLLVLDDEYLSEPRGLAQWGRMCYLTCPLIARMRLIGEEGSEHLFHVILLDCRCLGLDGAVGRLAKDYLWSCGRPLVTVIRMFGALEHLRNR
jgi:hypothetical protein